MIGKPTYRNFVNVQGLVEEIAPPPLLALLYDEGSIF